MVIIIKLWRRTTTGFFLILTLLWRLTDARVPLCPTESVADSILGFRDSNCYLDRHSDNNHTRSPNFIGVIEGNEISLQKALNMVHRKSHRYVAVLFYASWCPFSRAFRPSFSIVSSLYPSIPHFAIEESSIKPSILSKYGVHGFPTLFLINSSVRIRYNRTRTPSSLVDFYSDITGIKPATLDRTSAEKIGPSYHEMHNSTELENCPFSWARSPENLLQQETYLALATIFVVLRLIYLVFPSLFIFAQSNWIRQVLNLRFEHPLAYLNRAIQLFNSLKEPYKRSNLQEGAMNARAWASKSLATVSIGDASTSRSAPVSESR